VLNRRFHCRPRIILDAPPPRDRRRTSNSRRRLNGRPAVALSVVGPQMLSSFPPAGSPRLTWWRQSCRHAVAPRAATALRFRTVLVPRHPPPRCRSRAGKCVRRATCWWTTCAVHCGMGGCAFAARSVCIPLRCPPPLPPRWRHQWGWRQRWRCGMRGAL